MCRLSFGGQPGYAPCGLPSQSSMGKPISLLVQPEVAVVGMPHCRQGVQPQGTLFLPGHATGVEPDRVLFRVPCSHPLAEGGMPEGASRGHPTPPVGMPSQAV